MKIWFSPSTLSFYPDSLVENYESVGTFPSDAIEVSETVYIEFSGAAPVGKQRGVINKQPCWEDLPSPTHEEQIEAANVEKKRRVDEANTFIHNQQWPSKLMLDRLDDVGKNEFNQWLNFLDELEAVDTSTAPEITWPKPPEE